MPTRMSARRPSARTGRTPAARTSAEPRKPGTGAGRIRTTRAPRSSTQSSSSIALSTIGKRDDRRGEDAVLVVELPGLVHPLVQRVDDRVHQLRVVPHPLLDQAGQRREHQRAVEPLLVHQLEARRRLAERRDRAHRLAEDLAGALPLRIALAVVLLLRTGARHDVERRVGDVLADLAPDGDLGPAMDLDVVDRVLVALGRYLVSASLVSYRWLSASKIIMLSRAMAVFLPHY